MKDFYIRPSGAFEGPFTPKEILAKLKAGEITPRTPCISASWPDLREVGSIADLVRQPEPPAAPSPVSKPVIVRNRGVYIILGLLFGGVGFHNFYAGYHDSGVIKILFSIFLGLALVNAPPVGVVMAVIMFLWVLKDIVDIDIAADGTPMA